MPDGATSSGSEHTAETIVMTQRYSHLSPAHRLDAVQRLNQKPTDTKPAEVKTAVGAADNVLDLPMRKSAPGVIRTPDLQIRSLIRPTFRH